MKRKILSLLLAACMLLCLMPATAGAAEDRRAITLGTAAIPGYDSNTDRKSVV